MMVIGFDEMNGKENKYYPMVKCMMVIGRMKRRMARGNVNILMVKYMLMNSV